MKKKKYDVVGLGNALMDIQVKLPHSLLEKMNFPKGSMSLINENDRAVVLKHLESQTKNLASGGSVANSLAALAKLGSTTAMIGSVGHDDFGQKYKDDLENIGVDFLSDAKDGQTGTCIVLITEDAQRTMLTTLGCAPYLNEDHVNQEVIQGSKILYIEGYLWDIPETIQVVKRAMTLAKEAGTLIAFSASDAFCVNRHLEDFKHILKDWADIFFANAEEASALSGEMDFETTKDILAPQADYVAITDNANGSTIFHQGQRKHIEAVPTTAVDSTGAGDSYAAGILHGIAQGQSIEEMGKKAAEIASTVVSRMGPRY